MNNLIKQSEKGDKKKKVPQTINSKFPIRKETVTEVEVNRT